MFSVSLKFTGKIVSVASVLKGEKQHNSSVLARRSKNPLSNSSSTESRKKLVFKYSKEEGKWHCSLGIAVPRSGHGEELLGDSSFPPKTSTPRNKGGI